MEKKVYDFPRYYEVIRNLQPQACISVCDEDFGSRKALENEKDLIWYPAEVNTSIRPGWFYHPEEDNGVRPLICCVFCQEEKSDKIIRQFTTLIFLDHE
ncbi:MAG: hypothetical protein MST05_10325 [Treponema sp.]|nr:hypothetical protein [Treponema sp.]